MRHRCRRSISSQTLLQHRFRFVAMPRDTGRGRRRVRHRPLIANQADQPHAAHALDRDDEIHCAEDRPPAVSGALHPAEARKPFLRPNGQQVATEATGLDFEAEQAQPIAQAPVADELALARQIETLLASPPDPTPHAPEALAQTPQARRVEAEDHDAPFGHEHAFDLAQREMRIAGELERVRQHDEIEAEILERQRIEIAMQGYAHLRQYPIVAGIGRSSLFSRHPPVRHAIGAQGLEFDEPELQRVKTEQVGDGLIQVALFPFEQVATGGGLQPLGQTYNRAALRHEPDRSPRLYDYARAVARGDSSEPETPTTMTLPIQLPWRARTCNGLRLLAFPVLLLAGCATSNGPPAAPQPSSTSPTAIAAVPAAPVIEAAPAATSTPA